MGGPHALILPFPAQGHVIPMMTLSHRLIEYGIKITFVNTEFNHARVLAALHKTGLNHGPIHLVSIPDGLTADEDRNDFGHLCTSMLSVMPAFLEELIGKINESGDDKITYVIVDNNMGWAIEVAEKMGIPRAAFWPASASLLDNLFHIPKLIEDGIIDANGFPTKHQSIQLSPTMPVMNTAHLVWLTIGDRATQQTIFEYAVRNNQAAKLANRLICNSFHEIERSTFELTPSILPIGPLLAHGLHGNFWPEDSSCLSWLDQQRSRSVIYIAFGSFTVFNTHQFHELALGLELSGRPFLWVVRPDLMDGAAAIYPDGFLAKVADRGRVVGWAPQKKVLGHSSIACFITHCGWNSTLEGLVNGVPLLCWPYFADQFLNESYISDVWKVGLRMDPDSNGIISREEIKKKVEDLVGDEGLRARVLELKEMARRSVCEGGTSYNNFNDFVKEIKGTVV